MPIINICDLSVRYRSAMVLEKISCQVDRGDYVGIVGPNGSGKTTLIKAILGLLPPDQGQVEINGIPLDRFTDWQLIGYLPQVSAMANNFFPATVAEVVFTGLLGGKTFPRRLQKKDREKVDKILSRLGITNLASKQIGSLSGGQSQLVFLARAMVAEPEILILDEPTAALDPATRDSFYEMVAELNREEKTTILLITHDSATIGRYAARMLYLDRRLIFYGSFADFCHSQEMSQHFGDFAQHLICHQH